MGTFVGHDHNNDYAVMYKEVLLAYGRYSGGNTVYNNLANGARVIILQEESVSSIPIFVWPVARLNHGFLIRVVLTNSNLKDDYETYFLLLFLCSVW